MSDPYQDTHDAGVKAYLDLLDAEGDCCCEDCVVREILHACMDKLVELAQAEGLTTPVLVPEMNHNP